MSQSPLARRYAKALIELCAEAKNHAVIGKQLESFAETWNSSAELQAVLKSNQATLADKKEILSKIFQKHLFAPTTRNFLFVLLEQSRLDHIGGLQRTADALLDQPAVDHGGVHPPGAVVVPEMVVGVGC